MSVYSVIPQCITPNDYHIWEFLEDYYDFNRHSIIKKKLCKKCDLRVLYYYHQGKNRPYMMLYDLSEI